MALVNYAIINPMNLKIDGDIKFYFKALLLLFIIAGTLGFITAQQFPMQTEQAVEQTMEELSFIKDLGLFDLFLLISSNNVIKAFFMMLLGILWGIIPVLFILLNGYAIGMIVSITLAESGIATILLGTLPHGVLEIPAVVLAASYGVWLGERFVKKLRKETALNIHVKKSIGVFLKIILPLLVIAAFIETFITSQILDLLFI